MKIAFLCSKKHAGVLLVYLVYVAKYDHVFVRIVDKDGAIIEDVNKCVLFLLSTYQDANIDFYGDEMLDTFIQTSPLYRYIYTDISCKDTLPKIDDKFFHFYDPIFQLKSVNQLEDALRTDLCRLKAFNDDIHSEYFFLFAFYKHIMLNIINKNVFSYNAFMEIDLVSAGQDERLLWPNDKKIAHMKDKWEKKFFGNIK